MNQDTINYIPQDNRKSWARYITMHPKIRHLIARAIVDRKFYASKYPDVVESGLDLADHFGRFGFDVPIRSPNKAVEFLLLRSISLLLVVLSIRNIHRPDLEDIYLSRAQKAYQSRGVAIPVYYYLITNLLIYFYQRDRQKDIACNARPIFCESVKGSSIARYQDWIKDFKAYDPTRISMIEKIQKIFAPAAILMRSYTADQNLIQAETSLQNIERLARKNYAAGNRLRYWIYHVATKRLITKIKTHKHANEKLRTQVVQHLSLQSLQRCVNIECVVSEFEQQTPVGQAEIFGKADRTKVERLALQKIIIPRLRDATIFSKSNMVLLESGAINDTGAPRKYAPYISHSSDPLVIGKTSSEFLIKPEAKHFKQIKRGVMLSGVASNAWGHWFSDFMVRLEFCERIADFDLFPIIVDEEMPTSHYDLLRLVSRNEIIRLPNHTAFEVRELIYAPPLTFFPVHLYPNRLPPNAINPVNPQSYTFLKNRVEAKLPALEPPGRRIFLSRKNSSWRRLVNDEEVALYLAELGYETIQLEQYSLAEQIRIFQSASHIVAANGSSLQGVIFCRTDVKLLILAQTDLNNWGAYNAQVGALGYKMKFLCGVPVDGTSGKHADYSIPLDLLVAAMNKFET